MPGDESMMVPSRSQRIVVYFAVVAVELEMSRPILSALPEKIRVAGAQLGLRELRR